MKTTGWIAAGAASALGLGVLASAALTAANAMPLVDNATATDVPPISTAVGDAKAFAGNGDVRFWVASSTPVVSVTASASDPAVATTLTPSPPSAVAPAPAPTVQPAPAPAPQPVAPVQPGSNSISVPDSGSVGGSSD
ncbi:hypothetical protein EV141_0532 [Microcella putealis]|uniref:Uncharacterized protein n=1 Tax=Microcella putealis TaxID=337005 RepID=A0A4Q7LY06_9MICO|nr:hypothetical protein [Microcella putealis]RZS59312.1 hypothetical protein EV141_0532 [Microcella putealis]TQM19937.1 hypothetical protein BJ957_2069 [Microcella putealis]